MRKNRRGGIFVSRQTRSKIRIVLTKWAPFTRYEIMVARKLPATACAVASDEALAKDVQYTFNCPWLRVYTNTNVVGVELAAACNNIIAIAAGIIDGVGAGDNAKAALLRLSREDRTVVGSLNIP